MMRPLPFFVLEIWNILQEKFLPSLVKSVVCLHPYDIGLTSIIDLCDLWLCYCVKVTEVTKGNSSGKTGLQEHLSTPISVCFTWCHGIQCPVIKATIDDATVTISRCNIYGMLRMSNLSNKSRHIWRNRSIQRCQILDIDRHWWPRKREKWEMLYSNWKNFLLVWVNNIIIERC